MTITCALSGAATGWILALLVNLDANAAFACVFVCALLGLLASLPWAVRREPRRSGVTIAGVLIHPERRQGLRLGRRR